MFDLESKNSTTTQNNALAEAQMAYTVAFHRPRNEDLARNKMLAACKKQVFCRKAMYRVPVGGGKFHEDLNIRAAEVIIASWGNIRTGTITTFEDADIRRITIGVCDLENNVGYSEEITINKTKEKRELWASEIELYKRTTSKGETVYAVASTPEDVHKKAKAEASKAIRKLVLRLIPVDILIDMKDAISRGINSDISDDIDKAKKNILDGFSEIGIKPDELEKYLGQKASTLSAHQIGDLRKLYTGIKEGDTTWKEIVDAKEKEEEKRKGKLKKDEKSDSNSVKQKTDNTASNLNEKIKNGKAVQKDINDSDEDFAEFEKDAKKKGL